MKETTKNQNLYSALFCVIFGLTVVALASRIDTRGTYDALGPSSYPMALGLLITIMGGMLFLPAFNDKTDEGEKPAKSFSFRNFIPLVGVFICCGFYIVFLDIIGFVLTNIITLTCCTAILGERRIGKMLLFSVTTSVILYCLFRYLLGILLTPMPFFNI